MTEENEWEFRAFFDKIIQLPFSMPISDYDIAKYLQSLLVDVNYFDKSDLEDAKALSQISEIVGLSVGTNPRTLKRLANSVSLIEIIRGNEKITSVERFIEFALICIQIAYPLIYTLIQKKSDFTSWNDQFVYTVLKNKKIDESDLESLKESDEFDEPWEQNLWRICQVSTFLKQRAYQLSKLLNFIKENMPNIKDEEMGETLDRLLGMSSVTSVSAESVATPKKEKVRYDSIEAYSNILRDKNISEEVIENLTKLIKAIENTLGDSAPVTYAPSKINIKNLNSVHRRQAFLYISIQKKKIICGLHTEEAERLISLYPEGKAYGNGVNLPLSKENNFNFEQYMPAFVEEFKKMEEY